MADNDPKPPPKSLGPVLALAGEAGRALARAEHEFRTAFVRVDAELAKIQNRLTEVEKRLASTTAPTRRAP